MQYWKKLKAEKLQASTKYFLKYGRQVQFTTYFFDHVTLYINKTQNKKVSFTPSRRKETSESQRTTEV